MSLSTKWPLSTIKTVVQRELLDPNNKWWGSDELTYLANAWQDTLQDQFEFVKGTATITTSTSTLTLTDLATDIGRVDGMYWNNRRLVYKTPIELDILDREWRSRTNSVPFVVYQLDADTAGLWPTPTTAGTLVAEYPKTLVLASATDTISVPAWTRYSALNYICYRAYMRFGPNQDLNRAARYKAKFTKQLNLYTSLWQGCFPDKYISLIPGGTYEKNILQPEAPWGDNVALSTVQISTYADEVPTGTINSINTTFTLTQSPNPAVSLKLFLGGVLLTKDVHYTLSGSTITFESGYTPSTGLTLFASYRYYV